MQHRCARQDWCPRRETLDDGSTVGGAINAREGLCPDCERVTWQAIEQLPRDYAALNQALGGSTSFELGVVSGSSELPVPIRLSVQALQRAIVDELDAWARSVAEVKHVTWRLHGDARDGWRVDRAARLLSGSLSALLALRGEQHWMWQQQRRVLLTRDGHAGALELLRLHHRARAQTGQTVLVHHLPVPCPRCEDQALTRVDGSDSIECRSCTRVFTWDEYERLCLALTGRRTVGA